jgi:hypothetical protein
MSFNKSARQIHLEKLVEMAAKEGLENESWAVLCRSELAKLEARMRSGAVTRVRDNYRVECVKPAVSQRQIEAIKTAFTEGRDFIEAARLLQAIRDATATRSWTELSFIVSGAAVYTPGIARGDREQQYWGGRILYCLGFAYLAGEPVFLMPNSIRWARDRLSRIPVANRARVWTEYSKSSEVWLRCPAVLRQVHCRTLPRKRRHCGPRNRGTNLAHEALHAAYPHRTKNPNHNLDGGGLPRPNRGAAGSDLEDR